MKRILTSPLLNWFHGHWDSYYNLAFYGNWKAYYPNVGFLTNCVVMCGKNSGSIPNNILVEGIPVGYESGGIGAGVMSINICLNPQDNSDWAFRELMIWNTALSDADMVIASSALRDTLHDQVCM